MEKAPLYPSSWSDSSQLLAFDEAKEILGENRAGADGIAYVLQESESLFGVDFDDVRNPATGEIEDEVKSLITDFSSYTEISSSGTGLHVLLLDGDYSEAVRKVALSTGHVEVYGHSQYFVLTGDRLWPSELPSEPKPAGHAFDEFASQYLMKEDRASRKDTPQTVTDLAKVGVDSANEEPSDRSITEIPSGKPSPSRVRELGGKYEDKFARLWDGHSVDGLSDDSRLDAMLVQRLAFYCQGDESWMDDCFRASRRYNCRPEIDGAKWDEVHFADGSEYGEVLLSWGKKVNPDRYSGDYNQKSNG